MQNVPQVTFANNMPQAVPPPQSYHNSYQRMGNYFLGTQRSIGKLDKHLKDAAH